MIRRLVIPLLALVGAGLAIYAVVSNRQQNSADSLAPAPLVALPPSPFASFIAGVGIIEANPTNTPIGAPAPGVVAHVFVRVGDQVAKGEPLFALDERAPQQKVEVRRAQVALAEARLAAAEFERTLAEDLRESHTISTAEVQRRHLDWEIASSRLHLARVELKAAETDVERLTVRAPADGRILQLGVHPGQFAMEGQAPGHPRPLILFGNVEPLHLRVDVDEAQAWRLRGGAQALAFLHANPKIEVPLTLVRIEPALVAKTSLTGRASERADSRVLQVIYRFEKNDTPLFVGQQMDVFIESDEMSVQ